MRVLVIGMNYAPDLIGVAKYNTELCESLITMGHEVRVVTAPPYYPDWRVSAEYHSIWYRRERLNDVDVVRAPIFVPRHPSGIKRLFHHASFLLSAIPPVLSAAVRWRPDIIFAVAPSLLSAPIGALAARLVGTTSWLHVQDLEIDAAFELGLLRNNRLLREMMLGLERRILKSFDRVSTISQEMTRRMKQKGLAADRLFEFQNWIDTGNIAPGSNQTCLRSDLGLKPTDVVALYSGAMSNKQGLELVIEAARTTRARKPSLQFVLCGNGPAKPALMRMAMGASNVRFLDLQPTDRLSELLNTADIHLLPQKAQISDLVLPSKLAGMLASGRPIVAMADPGTSLARETEPAGLVVPPGDAHALAAATMALADDERRRRRFGAAARRRAQERWDRSVIIRSLELEFLALTRRPTVPVPLRLQSKHSVRSVAKR
jgi:colanic acid biosynthesis glycosyl transferase WcaI